MSMIHFQFSDSFVFDFNINRNEKLKLKFNLVSNKQLFLGHTKGSISQYEMVQDLKTHKFQNLLYCKSFARGIKNTLMNSVNCILLDKEKNELIVAYGDWEIGSWNLSTGKYTIYFDKMESEPLCMKWYFMNNTRYLIIGNSASEIEIWNWETKQLFKTLEGHEDWIDDMLVDQENQEMVTCGRSVIHWNLKTFESMSKIKYSKKHSKSVCFLDKNRKLFAVVDNNKEIKIYNKKTRKCVLTKKNACEWIPEKLIYSLPLNLLISCNKEKYIKCWKLDTEKIDLNLNFTIENRFGFDCLTIDFLDSNTQTQVLVGDKGGNLLVVDLVSKKIVWELDALVENGIKHVFI